MDKINLKARAKINIALDVVKRFENGYHDLRMIMQSVNLFDSLSIEKTNSGLIELTSNLQWLPTDERNLVYKASAYLKDTYSIKEGISIYLAKNIPVAAGLAGGSSDCAATLIGIRKLFNLPIEDEELMKIGKSFGADVPYCIMRGSALAEGIGEKLTKLPPFPFCYVLLSKPNISISTASVFGSLNIENIKTRPNIEELTAFIKEGRLDKIGSNMVNVLETVTELENPIISRIKQVMIEYNAQGAMMSGSGPTVFGLYSSKSDAQNAYNYLKNEMDLSQTYLTTIFNVV